MIDSLLLSSLSMLQIDALVDEEGGAGEHTLSLMHTTTTTIILTDEQKIGSITCTIVHNCT